jgi:hypothetical protein
MYVCPTPLIAGPVTLDERDSLTVRIHAVTNGERPVVIGLKVHPRPDGGLQLPVQLESNHPHADDGRHQSPGWSVERATKEAQSRDQHIQDGPSFDLQTLDTHPSASNSTSARAARMIADVSLSPNCTLYRLSCDHSVTQ